jgi:hypothetical protein
MRFVQPRSRHSVSSIAPVIAALILGGFGASCERPDWKFGPSVVGSDREIARVLGDVELSEIADADREDIPDIAPPASLRPCCAFGAGLQVEVGRVRVPGVHLSNMTGTDELGPHRYDNGLLSIDTSDGRGWVDSERNGLVYTCRGGFIDTAHVRDNADLTLYLAISFAKILDTGGVIELPDQGGAIRIHLQPVSRQSRSTYGRRRLSTEGAEWIAFQMSIWHEVATWYGYSSIEMWPEKISAFSPEDLYSNLIGIKIASGLLELNRFATAGEYNEGMDAWIRGALRRLGALSVKASTAAMNSVDGLWWDSAKRIPDWKLTLRRNSYVGYEISPWLVQDASPRQGRPKPATPPGCRGAAPRLDLQFPGGFEGVRFDEVLRLEIELDDKLDAAIPAEVRDGRTITQDDFPAIVESIRKENVTEFDSHDVNGP